MLMKRKLINNSRIAIDQPSLSIPDMEYWVFKPPLKADHIRVNRGIYYHHGIYVSDQEVIHFTGNNNDNLFGFNNQVIGTNLHEFLRLGICEVKLYNEDELADLYPPEGIVAYARSCLGDKGYNLVFNNCEHFANMCTLGKHRSKQVEKILTGGSSMRILEIVGSIFSSKDRTTNNYNYSYSYEPDKVRVAEIENKTKLMLMDLENKKISINKEAQKEIIQFVTESNLLLMKANEDGFVKTTTAIADLNQKIGAIYIERITEFSNKELGINGTHSMNSMLDELLGDESAIEKLFDERLRKLMENMAEVENDPTAYKIYKDLIDNEIKIYLEKKANRAVSLEEQRRKFTDSNLKTKKILEDHLRELNNKTLELCKSSQELIFKNEKQYTLMNGTSTNQLISPAENQLLLENKDSNANLDDTKLIKNK